RRSTAACSAAPTYLSRGGRARPNEHTSPPRRPTVADDDLDLIEAAVHRKGYADLPSGLALVAEVRRRRAIEDAARAQVESERSHEHYPERYPETDPWEVCAFCEETWPC